MTSALIARNALALLFDVTLKATVVLGLALLANRLLARRSAALRHLVLVVALAAIGVLPFAERVLPKLPTPGLANVLPAPAVPLENTAAAENTVSVAVQTRQPAAKPAAPKRVHSRGGYISTATTTTAATAPSAATTTLAVSQPVKPQASRWPLALALLWLAGALFFALRVAVAMTGLGRMLRRAAPVDDARWNTLLGTVTAALRIRRPVTLLASDELDVPITTGVIRPRVVLPLEASDWTQARCTAVLHHELAHVKRLDALTQLIAQAALALQWFNPLAWLAVRQMRLEREKACDDFVLAAGAKASEYAHELLEIVTQIGPRKEYAVALAMARKSQFEGRLLALLDPRRNRHALSRAAVAVTAIAALALVLPLAAMSPQNEASATPAQPATAATPAPPGTPAAAYGASQPRAAEAPEATPEADEPAVADAPEAEAQPTPAPTPEAAPEARAVEAAAPRLATPAPMAMQGVPAVPATPAAPPAAYADNKFPDPECKSTSGTTHVSMSSNTDDAGYQTLSGSWTKGECTLRIHAAGKLAFNAEGTALVGIGSDDGFFDVTESIGGSTRRVKVTPAAGGLKYEYWRNGQEQPMDDAARAWFGRFLLEFERHTGYAADTRVPAILARGGPNALLNEVSQMDSDYVASIYLRKMLETVKLDGATLRRTVEQSSRQLHSDYEKARVLLTIAQKYELADEASRSAFITGADTLKSDYEHARVLIEILKRPNLSKENARMALASAAKLNSDYERARVLMALLDGRMVDAGMQEMFFNAADGIKSDYEHSRTLIGLLDKVPLNQAIVVRLLQATARIQSGYERSRVLTATAEKYAITGPARAAYLQSANGIQGEYERNRALAALSSSTRM